MKKNIYTIIITLFATLLSAQENDVHKPGIGINTETPSRTLDVNGTTISKGENDKWFFENPGIYRGKSNDSYLTVIDKDDNKMKIFNPSTMSYASINYATFRFNKLPETGLKLYDTKIDASKYHVMVGGFIIYAGGNDTTSESVSGSTTIINGNVLYTSRAYIGDKGTWILTFHPNNGVIFDQKRIDLILNVAIYRKNLLLSDTNETIKYNMNNSKTGTVKAPAKI